MHTLQWHWSNFLTNFKSSASKAIALKVYAAYQVSIVIAFNRKKLYDGPKTSVKRNRSSCDWRVVFTRIRQITDPLFFLSWDRSRLLNRKSFNETTVDIKNKNTRIFSFFTVQARIIIRPKRRNTNHATNVLNNLSQ